jgi:ergothioneine biosynthesis protein EgtB
MGDIVTTSKQCVDRCALIERFNRVRAQSITIASPLSPEDMAVQVDVCASPTKWHLAHSTWFFETLVLKPNEPHFKPHDERWPVLFNSYYHGLGNRHPRARRGMLTRPSVQDVYAYRCAVDDRVRAVLENTGEDAFQSLRGIVELGMQHEQQHQELMLTDLKLLLAENPLLPSYRSDGADSGPASDPGDCAWMSFEGGVVEIGHSGDAFAYDNETPRHRQFLEPYQLADRLVTNGEYLEFIADGGYGDPLLWLDDGWTTVSQRGWIKPMYWIQDHGAWREFTLRGLQTLDPHRPVCHLSFFEADAFARWSGARLPTEAEWEHAANGVNMAGNFVESDLLHPASPPSPRGALRQCFGDVWEWTRSSHEPYPGYCPPRGPIGEYNGKFMNGQYVLRGGSCATSESHIRPTYRNFFSPESRWQFTGIRLARSTT